MTICVSSDSRLKAQTKQVQLTGIKPLMFDRYAGDNDTKLDWHQKIYLKPNGRDNELCLPVTNIISLLSAHNTNSAPKRLRDTRKYKKIANSILSFVMIEANDGGDHIPITRDGEPILIGDDFSSGSDPVSGISLHRAVARLEKGLPNPKERPLLPTPWEVNFKMTIVENSEIKDQEILNLLSDGGIAIGLGTYRGVYGKFRVTRFSEIGD